MLPLERLTLHLMASSWNCLLLTDSVSWDQFAAYAEEIVARLGGRMTTRIDNGGQRIWTFERQGLEYWITWDDLDPGVSIEPCTREAGDQIEALRELLLRVRGAAG